MMTPDRYHYEAFIERKLQIHKPAGLDGHVDLSPYCKDFQSFIIRKKLKRGRGAIFADCGMGKTIMQLEWARVVADYTKKPVLILAPLAVSQQTCGEGRKFGVQVSIVAKQGDVSPSGTWITNYQKMHHFDMSQFGGVVLDESSSIKAFDGYTAKTLIDSCQVVPFRLACSATPAPNDFMEIGQQAEFLGVQSRTGMLATYFNHDGGETSKWKLKGHAVKAFWKWVASWAVMCNKPSDLGFSDEGYVLPKLHRHIHTVDTHAQEGRLFAVEAESLSERRESRRMSISERVRRMAELVNADKEQWLVWGDLNDECDSAEDAIPDSVQVAGADTEANKESRMLGFSAGVHRVLVSKAKIAGWGMNWQNCANIVFLGQSDSWESTYQAERRCWRFGQKREVHSHTFVTDRDGAVMRNIERKRKQSEMMQLEMVEAVKNAQ